MDDCRLLVGFLHRVHLLLRKDILVPESAGSGPNISDNLPHSTRRRHPPTDHGPGYLPNGSDRQSTNRLAGKRRPTTLSVIHLRAGNRPCFDFLGVFDHRLFIGLLHATHQFGEPALSERLRWCPALNFQELRMPLLSDFRCHLDLWIYVSRIARLDLGHPRTE